MRLSKEAERLVDDILANRPAYFSKNQIREKLLAELSSRFRKQCEAIVFQVYFIAVFFLKSIYLLFFTGLLVMYSQII